jgi:NAD(P)-dependent dehydrogenase (short-subunit alcohol dehydrogenase family)
MSMFDLSGKVALVTGGGRGLGRGMALALAEAGADVVVTSRNEAELDESVRQLGAYAGDPLAVPADLSTPAGPEQVVAAVGEQRGPIDVMVHAAGLQVRKPALELSLEEWDRVQSVHLRAAFSLSQTIGRDMIDRGSGGSIILVSSLTANIGIRNTSAYGAAKSGIEGLMRTLATEWATHGVRVNAVTPGFFHTELTDAMFQDEQRREWMLGRIPMGRAGTPEDLAGAAVFLASDASAYVTGQAIAVDGGWLAA